MKTRAIGAIVMVGGTSLAGAQMLAFQSTGTMVRDLQLRGTLPTTDPGNPLQPKGFGEEDSGRTGKVPEPEVDDKAFQIIRSGHSRQDGDDVMMTGGAEFMDRGYHVFADTVEGNISTHIFSVSGDVKIIGKDALITGDRVTVDFTKKIYHAIDAKSDLKPGAVGGNVKKDLYVHGLESFGSANETETLYGGITSCDLLHPHYEIDGDNIIVRPGKRAIFRKARIKLFGRTILKIPYLSIPLDDRSYNNLPIVGQSPVEGYYVKWRYGIPLPGNNTLYSRLDYMSNLGVGIGADYLYQNHVLDGKLSVYTIEGPGAMLKITDDHNEKFKWGTLVVNLDYEDNNYLVQPGSTIQSIKTLLTFPQHNNALTKLTLSESGSTTSGFSSSSDDIAISDSRKFGKQVATTLDVDYQTSGTTYASPIGSMTSTQENLNVKFDATDDLKQAVAEFQYQRQIPVGSTQAVFGSNDITPELSFSSDSKRLFSSKFADNWPIKISASIGEFSDEFGNGSVSRDSLDLVFQHPDRSTGPWHSDISGEFKQGIYSDNTAQYVLNFADTESYKVGKNLAVNFHYNYLRPYGYSPVAIDTSGQTNLATADLSIKPIKTLSIGAQTGFDMLRLQTSDAAWQPIGIRTEWQPKDYFMLRTQATYDTFQNAWSNIRIDTSYKPGATFLSIGAYYDGVNHTWSNVNLFLDGLTWGKMKLSAILTYDGFLNQFDNQQYSLIYDLHCAEAVFTLQDQQSGFMPGISYSFMIRIKAFPFDIPFGAGSRGQPLGTSTGTTF